MSDLNKEIILKNIINCSADAKVSTAEIDLLISELFSVDSLAHKSIYDIRNEIVSVFENLNNLGSFPDSYSKYETIRERTFVCREIAKKAIKNKNFNYIYIPKTNNAKIAYWYSNGYAKDAFDTFSSCFASCTEIQVDSFTAVCEALTDDDTFGIIPIINSNDGRLTSFYRLLDKYDLKISATCKIESSNEYDFTKFALVGKKLIDTDSAPVKHVEFSTVGDVSDYIYVSEMLGGKINEITSIPVSHGKGECLNYISVLLETSNIYALWWYLYIFSGETDFIGIYSEI